MDAQTGRRRRAKPTSDKWKVVHDASLDANMFDRRAQERARWRSLYQSRQDTRQLNDASPSTSGNTQLADEGASPTIPNYHTTTDVFDVALQSLDRFEGALQSTPSLRLIKSEAAEQEYSNLRRYAIALMCSDPIRALQCRLLPAVYETMVKGYAPCLYEARLETHGDDDARDAVASFIDGWTAQFRLLKLSLSARRPSAYSSFQLVPTADDEVERFQLVAFAQAHRRDDGTSSLENFYRVTGDWLRSVNALNLELSKCIYRLTMFRRRFSGAGDSVVAGTHSGDSDAIMRSLRNDVRLARNSLNSIVCIARPETPAAAAAAEAPSDKTQPDSSTDTIAADTVKPADTSRARELSKRNAVLLSLRRMRQAGATDDGDTLAVDQAESPASAPAPVSAYGNLSDISGSSTFASTHFSRTAN